MKSKEKIESLEVSVKSLAKRLLFLESEVSKLSVAVKSTPKDNCPVVRGQIIYEVINGNLYTERVNSAYMINAEWIVVGECGGKYKYGTNCFVSAKAAQEALKWRSRL